LENIVRKRETLHPHCFACSPDRADGLGFLCGVRPDGTVAGRANLDSRFEGYPGMAQGGVVATLLDSAMAQCLMARGIAAVTGDLQVRFRHPVALEVPTQVQAWIVESAPPLYRLRSEARQGQRIMATGRGVFVDREGQCRSELDTASATGENAGDADAGPPGA
jgi:acyl-coenzyme A thioesterase PaaI-like protein